MALLLALVVGLGLVVIGLWRVIHAQDRRLADQDRQIAGLAQTARASTDMLTLANLQLASNASVIHAQKARIEFLQDELRRIVSPSLSRSGFEGWVAPGSDRVH
jgi:hypothetical protein